jgi:hypothetical protein
MLPILGGVALEHEQRFTISVEIFCRLVAPQAVSLEEGIEGRLGVNVGLCHPDILERAFGLRQLALW